MPQQNIYSTNEQFDELLECDHANFQSESSETQTKYSPPITFDGWETVPTDYKSKQDWESIGLKIGAGNKAAASVKTIVTRRMESFDGEYQIEKFHNLYHKSQTRVARRTELSEARKAFFERFAETADWCRLIKWTEVEFGRQPSDDEVTKFGWLTYKEKLTQPKLINHELGRDIYGVFGGKTSYHLLIDLDLHNQPLSLFETRLRILLKRFHGKYRCHFQLANSNAGGVHLILFFGKPGLLSTRRKWLLEELKKLDQANPEGLLTKQSKLGLAFNIEVYPAPNKACRLPLARERTMLLDKPLPPVERRGKTFQDVVSYMRWLDQSKDAIKYMPKDKVIKFITERLDLSKAKDAAPQVTSVARNSKVTESTSKADAPIVKKTSLAGRTKFAIISYWRDGQPTFSHLNSAIRTTLQALHAEGTSQGDAEAFVFQLVGDLPNKLLSSRLVDGLERIKKEIARQASSVFGEEPNEKWRKSIQHWTRYGFRVSDITSWGRMQTIDQVVVDCEEIDFTEDEVQAVIKIIAPIVVGTKQANKPAKQVEAIRATAYFLRYVKCCQREIPVNAIPQILSQFEIKIKKRGKSSAFIKALMDLGWIYLRTEYFCPKLVSGGRSTERGRARSYGIGPAMVNKFNLSKQEKNNSNNKDLYTAFPFSGGDINKCSMDASRNLPSDIDSVLLQNAEEASHGWQYPIGNA